MLAPAELIGVLSCHSNALWRGYAPPIARIDENAGNREVDVHRDVAPLDRGDLLWRHSLFVARVELHGRLAVVIQRICCLNNGS